VVWYVIAACLDLGLFLVTGLLKASLEKTGNMNFRIGIRRYTLWRLLITTIIYCPMLAIYLLSYRATFLFLALTSVLLSCKSDPKPIIDPAEVSAWCIIGFDTEDRSPEQRIDLVKELGIKTYGYNRGKADFSRMEEEFSLAVDNGINIHAVFLWLNANRDTIGQLSPQNIELLTKLKKVQYKPTIWVSFSNNYFKDKDQATCLKISTDMIKYVVSTAKDIGCEVGLYNHTGWFGDPKNQIKIIEAVNDPALSIVWNFHHGHDYIDDFESVISLIKPHLSYVNLNGMKKGGPKILPIGDGDHDYEMMDQLIAAGYNGPWGILGHVKTEDVEVVLKRNLKGLEYYNARKQS
jgi:sugar phosphate isomerase/epimerase